MKKETTELLPATREAQPLARPQALDIENVFKYAIEHQGTAETMEKLMAIRRELNAEASKKAFDEAMAAFQSDCPVIEKRKAVMNKDGRSIRYKYAPLDDIVTQVKPFLLKHGFSYTLTSPTEQNKVKAICRLTHRDGHSLESEFAVPTDPQAFMNEQQKFAAALTFAKRYAFCNALGILTGDEDTDGRTTHDKPQGMSALAAEPSLRDLAKELWEVLKPIRGDEKNWNEANQWLWMEEILDGGIPEAAPELTAEQFRKAIKLAKERLAP